jgi:hypothetical protein
MIGWPINKGDALTEFLSDKDGQVTHNLTTFFRVLQGRHQAGSGKEH